MLLEVDRVTLRFSGVTALNDLSFKVREGQISSLIGPNGAGKTSLFNCVSRLYTPNSGNIRFNGNNLLEIPPHGIASAGISRSFQNVALFPAMTVVENVMTGGHVRTGAGFLRSACRIPPAGRQAKELREHAHNILELLDIRMHAQRPVGDLPFGSLKLVELARALISEPRLLLLDEPANGLPHGEVEGLVDLLRHIRKSFDLTILLVEHHMGMVMQVSDHIVVLDFGTKIAAGSPEEIRNDEAVIEAYLGRSE